MKNIITILKKELKRIFTDPRMIATLVLPGLIVFIVYTVIGNVVSSVEKKAKSDTIVVMENQPVSFKVFDDPEQGIKVHSLSSSTKEQVLEAIQKGDVALLIIYEKNFLEKVEAYDSTSGKPAPKVEIYYNSTKSASSKMHLYYSNVLSQMEVQMININKFDMVMQDTAKPNDLAIMLISMILPGMLIIFLTSGSMGIVTESIAGEKERGTIAALLITPVKRGELAVGKVLSLSLASLLCGLTSFAGVMGAMPSILRGIKVDMNFYTASHYFGILAIILSTVILITNLMVIMSTFAKSVKEANGYSGPIILLAVIVAVPTMTGIQIPSSIGLNFIPLFNSVNCLSQIFSLNFSWINFAITILMNLVYSALGIFILSKMFNNERIMFRQ